MRDAYVESLEEMHKDVEKLICALKDTVKRTGQAMLSMDVDMAREIRDGDEAFDNMIRDIYAQRPQYPGPAVTRCR